MIPPLVPQFRRQPASGQRHQEVTKVMGKLYPGRLGQGKMQLRLEVLVHNVNHAVTESPQEKKRTHQHERDKHIRTVRENKHTFFVSRHNHSFEKRDVTFQPCFLPALDPSNF